MRRVPRWAMISSGAAPVLLVGGWTLAAGLQDSGYNPVTETISTLAGSGARDSWLMTAVLLVLGTCHSITALGLRPAATAGRLALACGGVASILVAFSPEASSGGPTARHTAAAALGAAAITAWPSLAAVHYRPRPWALGPVLSVTVSVLLLLTGGWFLLTLRGHGAAGVAERVLTGAQTLWPFVVVASCFRSPSRPAQPSDNGRSVTAA